MLKELAKIYNDGVKLGNSNHCARLLKKCTKAFFEYTQTFFEMKNTQIHFENIKYLDGYFIFGMGKNSVVHFNIKELTGWQFGIWWNIPKNNRVDVVSGQFFAQRRETLDKFKPAASDICYEFEINIINKKYTTISEHTEIYTKIERMLNYPYIEICDEIGIYKDDMSESDAIDTYLKWRSEEVAYEESKRVLDDVILNYITKNALSFYKGAKIVKHENRSPQYEIEASYWKNRKLVPSKGIYNLFNDEEDLNKYAKVIEECKCIAENNDIYWFVPIYEDITICTTSKFLRKLNYIKVEVELWFNSIISKFKFNAEDD